MLIQVAPLLGLMYKLKRVLAPRTYRILIQIRVYFSRTLSFVVFFVEFREREYLGDSRNQFCIRFKQ